MWIGRCRSLDTRYQLSYLLSMVSAYLFVVNNSEAERGIDRDVCEGVEAPDSEAYVVGQWGSGRGAFLSTEEQHDEQVMALHQDGGMHQGAVCVLC